MNTLFVALFSALRSHKWLRLVCCAYILSSLGNGLTQIIVFGQLLQWHVSAFTLTIIYILSMLPSFIGSIWGEYLCRKISPLRILIFTEFLGLIVLIFPLYGLIFHNVPLLLSVECWGALFSSISYPALALLFKSGLRREELGAATAVETVIFSSHVLLGTGLGVLLFNLVSFQVLLTIDALSFITSITLLLVSKTVFQKFQFNAQKEHFVSQNFLWRSLSPAQKQSIILLPVLAAVGSPAMALLPALSQEIAPSDSAGMTLPLVFARSLGQLCGPLLLNTSKLEKYSTSNAIIVICLGVFIGSYFLLPQLGGFQLGAMIIIFCAHMASNIVFALGTFSLLNNFTDSQIAKASAIACRGQVLIATLSTVMTSIAAQYFGAFSALCSISICNLVAASVLLLLYAPRGAG